MDLSARLPRLRAVVLHSPILSGLRVMYPVKRTYWFDIYKVKFLFTNLFDEFAFNGIINLFHGLESELDFTLMCRTLIKSLWLNVLCW